MVYQDKNEEVNKKILKQYKIRGFPTFVILDSEGKELGRPSLPRNLEGAKLWFSAAKDAYLNSEKFEAAFAEKPSDDDTAKKMAGIYFVQGKSKEAVEIFEKVYERNADNIELAKEFAQFSLANRMGSKAVEVYESLYKEDTSKEFTKEFAELCQEARNGKRARELYAKLLETAEGNEKIDLQLANTEALKSTATRANQKEVYGKVVAEYETFLPELIKAKDERAVDPGILSARVKIGLTEDSKGAVELMTKLEAAFGDGDRGNEVKYWAAVVTIQGGDDDGGKAKLEALVKDGDAEDEWVKNATKRLERMSKKGSGKKSER